MKRLFLLIALLVLVTVVTNPSRVLAQDNSQLTKPGLTPLSRFYFLDRWLETIQEILTFNPEAKVKLQLQITSERIAEMKIIIDTKGEDAPEIEKVKAAIDRTLYQIGAIISKQEEEGKNVEQLATLVQTGLEERKEALESIFDADQNQLVSKEQELSEKLKQAKESGDQNKFKEVERQFKLTRIKKEILKALSTGGVESLTPVLEKYILGNTSTQEKQPAEETSGATDNTNNQEKTPKSNKQQTQLITPSSPGSLSTGAEAPLTTITPTTLPNVTSNETGVSIPKIVTTTPSPIPCVCIESWGAGGFKGLCRDKKHCMIKYSCLLPDKQRLGVWNEDQTLCLEQYVRTIEEARAESGESNGVTYQTITLDSSSTYCNERKAQLDSYRNLKIQQENTRYQAELDSIREDYANRGIYSSGERYRSEGLAEVGHQNNLQDIENDYQHKLSGLKTEGCNL